MFVGLLVRTMGGSPTTGPGQSSALQADKTNPARIKAPPAEMHAPVAGTFLGAGRSCHRR